MAGGLGVRPGQVNSEVNLVPMIDVLLVLVIIGLVLAMKIRHIVADVQVPPATPSNPTRLPQIVLELSATGTFSVNGMRVAEGQLDTVLRQIFSTRVTKLLFIKAAPNLPYQAVVTAADRAKGAGVQVIAIVPRS